MLGDPPRARQLRQTAPAPEARSLIEKSKNLLVSFYQVIFFLKLFKNMFLYFFLNLCVYMFVCVSIYTHVARRGVQDVLQYSLIPLMQECFFLNLGLFFYVVGWKLLDQILLSLYPRSWVIELGRMVGLLCQCSNLNSSPHD